MGQLTHLVLTTMHRPRSLSIERMNAWCQRNAEGQMLLPVYSPDDETARNKPGGHKVFCSYVYMCCANYFPDDRFIAAFPTFGWHEYLKETTVCILRREHDDFWIAINGEGIVTPLGTGL